MDCVFKKIFCNNEKDEKKEVIINWKIFDLNNEYYLSKLRD